MMSGRNVDFQCYLVMIWEFEVFRGRFHLCLLRYIGSAWLSSRSYTGIYICWELRPRVRDDGRVKVRVMSFIVIWVICRPAYCYGLLYPTAMGVWYQVDSSWLKMNLLMRRLNVPGVCLACLTAYRPVASFARWAARSLPSRFTWLRT